MFFKEENSGQMNDLRKEQKLWLLMGALAQQSR